ncbi:polysaccharide biosynthesis C-terminal domain-containing protein [uncultured Shewanella sp.]|uniref:lipopolysaccharide biosynthesis protein n=1 Tax=uncultured Shewanella sp. TaxID=173975 RepID=UPI00260B2B27|nr:polysaccharide biosynthesis C-terminal domain-containing protein [uncultured Shewanella sp.]
MIKTSFVYLATSVFSKLSPFLLLPILTSHLSTADFAKGSLYISSLGFISILMSLGTQAVIPKYYFNEEKENFSKIVFNVVLICSIAILIVLACVFLYFIFFNFEIYYLLLALSAGGIVFNNLYLSLLRTMGLLKKYVFFEVFYTIANFSSVYFLVTEREDFGLASWVIPVLLINICFAIFSIINFIKISNPIRCNDYNYFKSVVFLCLPLIPHSLSLIVINISDRYILNKYLESDIVATYLLAANLSIVMKVISDAFMKAWNPFYFKNKNKKDMVLKYKQYFIAMFIIFSIVFYFLISLIFSCFFSNEYILALDILPVLIFSYLIFVVYQLNVSVLISQAKTSYLKYISPFAAIVNISGNILFIPKYGVMAAALMTSISYFIMALLTSAVINIKKDSSEKKNFNQRVM